MDDEGLPPPPEYPSDPVVARAAATTWAYAILAGAVMVGVGVFLPWISVEVLGTSIGFSGWDAGNYGTLILAGFGLYEGINAVRGAPRRGSPAITGVILVVFLFLDWNDIQNARAEIEASAPNVDSTIGIGLIMVAIGAVLLIGGGVMDRRTAA